VLIKNAQYNKPSEDGKRPEPLVQPAEQLQHSGYSASVGTASTEGTKGAHCRYSSAVPRLAAAAGPSRSRTCGPRLCIGRESEQAGRRSLACELNMTRMASVMCWLSPIAAGEADGARPTASTYR
jgi:hypothetical protein